MQFKEKIIICDPIDEKGINILKNNGFDVNYQPEIGSSELKNIIHDYDIIIVRSRTKIDKEIIEKATKTKAIARVGVGLDNIDIQEAKRAQIQVINAPEAAMNAVSELVIGMMFDLARKISFADIEMKKGKWLKKELMGTELRGKYLGIIGVGNIGRNIGRIAKSLRMNLIGFDIYPINREFISETGLITTDLKTLIQSSDFITCHVPSTPETKKMIDKSIIDFMKPTAFFINTSRGDVVDEEALFQALKDKKIAGAGLDVFNIEPPTNLDLIQLPNVICTPHIGAQTKEAQELGSIVIAEKIIHTLLQSKQ